LEINKDFMRLLRAFAKVDARYLLVGAFAVEYHGQPRTTRHMDLWLDDAAENMDRVYRALTDFGAPPIAIDHLNAAPPLEVVWIGVPPNRIDLAKGLRGLEFAASASMSSDARISSPPSANAAGPRTSPTPTRWKQRPRADPRLLAARPETDTSAFRRALPTLPARGRAVGRRV
jgi:hypothetical protein